MCAIFGFLADIEQPENILDKMSSALLHRGPDDQGKYIEGRLGLGHNRKNSRILFPHQLFSFCKLGVRI